MSKKVSAFDPLTSLDGTELIGLVKGTQNYRATTALLYTLSGLLSLVNVENIPNVVVGVVNDAQRVINTTAINGVLATGARIWLRSGVRVEIASSLFVKSNGGIIGEPGGIKPTIFMPASKFTNTNNTTIDGTWAANTRYGSNAVGINYSGLIDSPFTSVTNVLLSNFIVESDPSIGRYLRAVVGLNTKDCVITDVEAKNFPTAIGICFASAVGLDIIRPYIHDFADSTNWASLPQITGIEGDNDLVNGVGSTRLVIREPRIENLTVSGGFKTNWGYNTDGINICNNACTGRLIDPYINNVGEGIDCFGTNWVMANLQLYNCYNFAMKFIHGARANKVMGMTVSAPGLAAVGFFGSDTAALDTIYNIVNGLTCDALDPSNNWPGSNSACVLITDNGATLRKPRENQVNDASLNMGANGEYGWLDTSTGSNNFGDNIGFVTGASTLNKISVTAGGGSCRPKGTTSYLTTL